MNFFSSDLVQKEIEEIKELQDLTFSQFCDFENLSYEEKQKYVGLIETLLNKQKIFYTRLSLSSDAEAIDMKTRIQELFNDVNIFNIFENLESLLSEMKMLM
ncbi:MAG: DUF1825 family protein [Spirochaetia bacterium]|nr:DUF1825 family protein [Spirochaetia bacterium]